MEKPNIPKQVTVAGDKIAESEKSDTPALQQAQKPLLSTKQEDVQLQSSTGGSPEHQPKVPSNTSSVSFAPSTSGDHDAPFRRVASSPTVAAGLLL